MRRLENQADQQERYFGGSAPLQHVILTLGPLKHRSRFCKRSETLASHPVLQTLSPVSPMCVQLLLLSSSQLYLNDGRAKQKHDFPSRGQ
jgi:hypothetical protein